MRKIFVFSILGLLSIALFGCSPKYIQNKQYDKTVEITNYYRCTHPDLLVPNESNYDYINENAMFIFVAKSKVFMIVILKRNRENHRC